MKCLVLGGNGFIGSHLVKNLLKHNIGVRIFDRPNSLHGEPFLDAEYVYGDFHTISEFPDIFYNIDIVIHLISTTVPATSNLNPVGDIKGNLITTVNLLEQMRHAGIKRIIYLSSGGTVYGHHADNVHTKFSESSQTNPISSYGAVKLATEKFLQIYQTQYGISPTILRVSNPYGPLQQHIGIQGVIATFFNRTLNNETIKLYGTPDSERDYIYIDDLINAITLTVITDFPGVYNLGNGVGISLGKILDLIQSLTERKCIIEQLPARPFDLNKVILDVSKFETTFSWVHKVDIEEGCNMYWEWLKTTKIANQVVYPSKAF